MHTKICCLFLLLFCFRAQAQKTYTYKDTIFTTSGELLVGRIMFMAEDTVYLNYYLPDSTIASSTIARNAVQRTGLSARRAEIIDEEEKHINKLPWTLAEK